MPRPPSATYTEASRALALSPLHAPLIAARDHALRAFTAANLAHAPRSLRRRLDRAHRDFCALVHGAIMESERELIARRRRSRRAA